MKINKTFFLIGFLAFIVGVLLGLRLISIERDRDLSPRVIFEKKTIFVELAKTPQEKEKGLSGREGLETDYGMLFVFEKTGFYPFWMKEMEFDLDFIFFEGETVVDLKKNVSSQLKTGKIETVTSEKEFDRLLEVEAGVIDFLGLQVGDQAKIIF